MPKLKTKKAVKKRFRITAKGKILKSHIYRRHLLGDRSSNRKRRLRRVDVVDKTDQKRLEAWLPYDH